MNHTMCNVYDLPSFGTNVGLSCHHTGTSQSTNRFYQYRYDSISFCKSRVARRAVNEMAIYDLSLIT